MTLGHGPKIVTDGLVFAYDMGPNPGTNKSWRGAPTTNYFSVNNTTDLGNWSKESASVEVIATGEKFKGQNVYKCKTQNGASYISFNSSPNGLTALTGNVTMSVMVKNTNPNAYNVTAYIGYDFSSVRTISANSDWQKIQWTVPVSNMNSNYCEIRPYTNTDNVYLLMTMPQIEPGDFATPFTTGTRSNTQTLLDWTGNNTITANSLTYNSDGTFSFNGSNTYASFSNPISENGPYTVIQWLKPSTALSSGGSGANKPGGTNRRTSIVGPGPVWNPGIWVTSDYIRVHAKTQYRDAAINWTTTDWKMIGMTYDGTNCQIIFNGEFLPIAFTTSISFATATTMYLGAETTGGSSVNWLGNIGATQMYNKVLTAAEIAQNFQALRGRYGV
jgi:hypothetical protein